MSASAKISPALHSLCVEMLPGERWWGTKVADATRMPFTAVSTYRSTLHNHTANNQAQPLLLSSHGRYLWCEAAFDLEIEGGAITLRNAGAPIVQGRAGNTLREACLAAAQRFFPPSGKLPDPFLFTAPQYCSWIELLYEQNERDLLAYAENLIARGYPPGLLIIDDTWQEDYGIWRFHPGRFQNPKAMIARLHALGFKVMLWVVPYLSPDSKLSRDLAKRGFLVTEKDTAPERARWQPYPVRWWNGISTALDLSNPEAVAWFVGQLRGLQRDYGVDGFKFDAGDPWAYVPARMGFRDPHSNGNLQSELYARLGLDFPLNEFRACWKLGNQPLNQRQCDKSSNWHDLPLLVPSGITQGLMGYAFNCPDMIGGGDYVTFLNLEKIDQESFVRYAQIAALFPMMQFSAAPWRVLDEANNAICRDLARLHVEFAPRILALAQESARTGEPILRSLEYQYPHQGYVDVMDQFLLGDALMVAPATRQGQRRRTVAIPPGRWRAEDGQVYEGPAQQEIDVPLSRLPRFERISSHPA